MSEEPQVPGEGDDKLLEHPEAPDITEAVETLLDSIEDDEPSDEVEGEVQEIRILGASDLRAVCEPVAEVDEGIRQIAHDMVATMLDYNGIGLAAPQIGQLVRMVVVLDYQGDEPEETDIQSRCLINPVIVESEGEFSMLEGCLSIPGARGTVSRSNRVVVEYLDIEGEPERQEFVGSQAAAIQHEIDHLDGKLFIDHLSKFQRSRAMQRHRKVMKQAWRQAKRHYS